MEPVAPQHDRLRQRLASSDAWAVKVEARSVNHRFIDVVAKLPKGYQALEERIRRVTAEYVQRGRVEIFVTIEEFRTKERTVRIDPGLLRGYAQAFREAAELLGRDADLEVDKILSFPDVLVVEEREVDVDAVWPLVEEALREALEGLAAMRRAEGERLFTDIAHRLEKLEQIIQRMEDGRRRWWSTTGHALGTGEGVAGGAPGGRKPHGAGGSPLRRAGQHRRGAHPGAKPHREFLNVCRVPRLGRKLDFLLQELNRKINTIGSKAHDAQLAAWVVEGKAEVEKIREQVQNIE